MKVTYLLGAGASIGAIPLVKATQNLPSIAKDIINFADQISTLKNHPKVIDHTIKLTDTWLNELVNDLNAFGERSEFFSSPDTYLKSLYLNDPQSKENEKSKKLLSFYLDIKQLQSSLYFLLNPPLRPELPFEGLEPGLLFLSKLFLCLTSGW